MKIAIASDHRGFRAKQQLLEFLLPEHEVKDFGCFSEDTCDYPDYAFPATRAVANREYDRGILICGSGIGMCISANKVPGIRAALCVNKEQARMAMEHNQANVICLAASFTPFPEMKNVVTEWLRTVFTNEPRHRRRIDKIRRMEQVLNETQTK